METLYPIKLPPGLARNGTAYQNKNRWINGNLVRWHEGAIRPIGGWQLALDNNGQQIQAIGKPRCSLGWRKADSTAWLGLGTTGPISKLYALNLSTLSDITPAGLVNGAQDGSQVSGGLGWGLGGWGITPWGGGNTATTTIDADSWQLDNFGEILLACLTGDGKIYESTPTTQATQVTNSPTGCRGVVVTPERFIFALGASSDPRNVAWCAQQARTVWTATGSNSAGSFPLQTVGRLMAGRRTDRETLLWTDADLWAAVFIGGNAVYSFQRRGDSCGLLGPNAVTIAEGTAFWMSDNQFFVYDGAVRSMPCEVSDYVFGDLNKTQKAKIAAVPNVQFGEVTWYYPSASQNGLENDRYVTLNYRAGFWMTGSLARATGVGAAVFANPQLWDPNGLLYAHESGQDRAGNVAFLESGPIELGNGDRVVRLQSLIPDERTQGDVVASIYATFYPESPEVLFGPYQLSSKTDIRLTARQIRLRVAENNIITGLTADQMVMTADQMTMTADTGPAGGVDWRVGDFRLGGLVGGIR